jgi:hypothetical protein
MKYSQYIGVALIIAFAVVAFQAWIYIPSVNSYVKGMDQGKTTFGMVALFSLMCLSCSVPLFLIPRVWAKRTNLFFTAMNLAWSFKNLIVLSVCPQGDCPQRLPSLYIQFGISIAILIMAFLPDLPVAQRSEKQKNRSEKQ